LVAPLPSVVMTDTGLGEQGYLFRERTAVRLPAGTIVNIDRPGTYAHLEPLSGLAQGNPPSVREALNYFATLQAPLVEDVVVDSYLLHFDPTAKRATLEGTIEFPGRIVGVMTSVQTLLKSDATCGLPEVEYEPPDWENRGYGFGLEQGGDGDRVTIAPDQRRLTVHMVASTGTDMIRILVVPDLPVR
jgi:hypothetical protein